MVKEPSNATNPEQPIAINAQYIKDLSFEAPGAPNIFAKLQEEAPEMNVNVSVGANPIQDKIFETVLDIKAECKVKGELAFVLELEYAGIFTINVPEEHTQVVLLVECPRLLFPFARNIIADVSRDGGFQPVLLNPLDFGAMLQARIQEAKNESVKEEEAEIIKE
jgi:preprotein translocase subunit SecB